VDLHSHKFKACFIQIIRNINSGRFWFFDPFWLCFFFISPERVESTKIGSQTSEQSEFGIRQLGENVAIGDKSWIDGRKK
jgi:hypothetical protein